MIFESDSFRIFTGFEINEISLASCGVKLSGAGWMSAALSAQSAATWGSISILGR